MPGTVMVAQEVVVETLIHVMLGLWNHGCRKQIIINNHGQLWMLETALHEFFIPIDRADSLETTFIHADESETAVALLMFHDMIDMKYVRDARGPSFLPGGHFDTSVDPWRRPHRWSEGEGHVAIERKGTPEGVVGEAAHRRHPPLPDPRGGADPRRLSIGQAPAYRPDHSSGSQGA
jgi:creatinine amidohydrolase